MEHPCERSGDLMHNVLHVLANSAPDVNGYATRTHGLLKASAGIEGVKVAAITSPWYAAKDSLVERLVKDGITYHRCPHPSRLSNVRGSGMKWVAARGARHVRKEDRVQNQQSKWKTALRFITKPLSPGWSWIEERIQFKHFTRAIIETASEEQATIIHAHVPYRVGVPAMRAARTLNIPFVYEMRGLWEDSAVAAGRWSPSGLAYRRFRRMETKVLRQADAVVCISETLRDEALARGVSPERLFVVPNAVSSHQTSTRPAHELQSQVNADLSRSPSTCVVGYIGSLRSLEGVDLTVEAVAHLHQAGHDVRLFVLTGHEGQDELRALCKSLGIERLAVVAGPVPHEDVGAFYELIDLFVVSRPDTRVTRLVTPIKPFEAMLHGKTVVVSNLPALKEIVDEGVTGLVYEAGDAAALAGVLAQCLEDVPRTNRLGGAAQEWVLEHRVWDKVVAVLPEVYSTAKGVWES